MCAQFRFFWITCRDVCLFHWWNEDNWKICRLKAPPKPPLFVIVFDISTGYLGPFSFFRPLMKVIEFWELFHLLFGFSQGSTSALTHHLLVTPTFYQYMDVCTNWTLIRCHVPTVVDVASQPQGCGLNSSNNYFLNPNRGKFNFHLSTGESRCGSIPVFRSIKTSNIGFDKAYFFPLAYFHLIVQSA